MRCAVHLLLLLLIGSTAGAQSAKNVNMARRLFKEGNEQLDQKRYRTALVLYFRSLKLVPRSSTELNIAQCYRLLRQPDKALRHYQAYVKTSRKGRRYLAEVHAHIQRLEGLVAEVARGVALQKEGDHRGAIAAFEAVRDQEPWPLIDLHLARSHKALDELDQARTHVERARAALQEKVNDWSREDPDGEAPDVADFKQELAMAERLREALEPKPPSPARLTLAGLPPKATVFVDGRPQPSGTLVVVPGKRELRVEAPGFKTWSKSVVLDSGSTVSQRVSLEQARNACRACLPIGISAAALAVAAEVAAIILMVKGNNVLTTDPAIDSYKTANIASHVTAGAMAIGSAVSFYFWYRGRPTPAASGGARWVPQPSVSSRGFMLGARARF